MEYINILVELIKLSKNEVYYHANTQMATCNTNFNAFALKFCVDKWQKNVFLHPIIKKMIFQRIIDYQINKTYRGRLVLTACM